MDTNKIDILNRDKFVDDVFTVIETLSANRKSCTFAINGEWGSGKSFVLDMLEEKLSAWQNEDTADDKYIVFHYNCWKYDYYDEPLFAIVTAMYDWLKSNDSKFETYVKNLLLYTIIAFGLTTKELAKNIVEKITSLDFGKISQESKDIIEKINKKGELDDELSTVQESIVFTRDLLSSVSNEKTVVVVVDELDRCLPEYAIKVLERLHHIFDDVDNLIVILAVDKEHLNNTVSQIFGFDEENDTKDIDSYLAKFIDFEIELNKGTVDDNYKLKYCEYFSKFNNDDDSVGITEYVSALLDDLDARTRNRVFEKALLIHNIVFNEMVDISIMCVELLFVVYSVVFSEVQIINKDTFLFNNSSQYFPRFTKVFVDGIVKVSNLGIRSNVYSGEFVGYSVDCGTNIRRQILFYISCHPKFLINFFLGDEDQTQLNKNAEKIKRFYELIDIIK